MNCCLILLSSFFYQKENGCSLNESGKGDKAMEVSTTEATASSANEESKDPEEKPVCHNTGIL